ncbi:transposase [Bacillus paramycoides]|nr:transposase [Bacillus paramycoides]
MVISYRTRGYLYCSILYDYQPTRAGEHPKHFLTGFKGSLQVDGYSD